MASALKLYCRDGIGVGLWPLLEDREALAASAGGKTVFMRYDIHVRDIAPLYAILDVNRALGIPSVSFLQWDYSEFERGYGRAYVQLKKFEDENTRFGLHADPVESVLVGDLP